MTEDRVQIPGRGHPERNDLCVVVKLADNDAFVLTAYLVRKPVGGRQLWPKRN